MGKEPHFPDGLVITVDGNSGSGKSSLAKKLAIKLNWSFLDSGAWYRALTWATLRAEADTKNEAEVLATLSEIEIHCDSHGKVFVDGEACIDCLRTPLIDQLVSEVADHVSVREALNKRMREMACTSKAEGLVADGRDAGTIIFPDAALKVFVRAGLSVRAERRFQQMQRSGIDITLPEVQQALAARDAHDALRGDAAPHPTVQSRILDNDNKSLEEAVGCLLTWALQLQN
ncbi:MAG: (d)CMP kinase [Planctomycetota bacterium]|nr:(d)CMP kinase [Planctomycetota bacterium]MDA1112954.1 (d)CMP kinase [Planctomycetota bacterium]